VLLFLLAASHVGAAEPITYSMRTLGGVSLHVLDIDLNDPHVVVSPALAAGGIGRSESFSKFIHRLNPAAALNGTFFSKTSLRPIGDIVIDGKLVHFGGMGTALAFTTDGVDCIRLPKSRHVDWSEHRAALAAGPLLVWNGFAKPLPGGEGFGDPSVFASAAPRTAAGVTRDNHLLLVTTKGGTSLRLLAAAMRDIGALYAVNLDGGGSTGMWRRGRMIRRPVRQLTNILCVYVEPDPAPPRQLRPPRGLDWRAGHRPRPTLSFTAGDLRVTAHLPRTWEGQQPVQVEADAPVPDGWTVSIWLDERPLAVSSELPFEFALDLAALPGPGPKHSLWIGILDREGKIVGRAERIFRPGDSG
jgi:hypothetical protein